MRINRRNFLRATGSAFITQFIFQNLPQQAWSFEKKSANRWLILSNQKKDSPTNAGTLNAFNPETKQIIAIDVPFFGHEVVASPLTPNVSFSCVKWGTKAALVDFKTKKVLQIIETPTGTRFYGHAIWSKDAKRIYVSAQNDNSGKGTILVFNAENLKLENQFDSGGIRPHQLSFKNDDEIIILNQDHLQSTPAEKDHSVFGIFSLKSSKIVESISLNNHSTAHFVYDPKRKSYFAGGNLYGKNNERLDTILENVAGGNATQIEIPNVSVGKIQGELLSLQISSLDPSLMAFTVADGGYIFLYDLDKKKFLLTDHSFKVATRGVFFSTTEPNILFANDNLTNLHTLKIEKSGSIWQLKHIDQAHSGNGAHLNQSEWV